MSAVCGRNCSRWTFRSKHRGAPLKAQTLATLKKGFLSQPEQMPRVLEIAMQTARAPRRRRGHSARRCGLAHRARAGSALPFPEPKSSVCLSEEELATLAGVLNTAKSLTIRGGVGCAGAHVSRQELSMPPTITLDQVHGFGLFMLKAVLSGRGSEIIDLAKGEPAAVTKGGAER